MKKLLLGILVLAGPASAQQAHLESFSADAPSSFRMLIPGASVPAETPSLASAPEEGSSGLETDFANLGGEWEPRLESRLLGHMLWRGSEGGFSRWGWGFSRRQRLDPSRSMAMIDEKIALGSVQLVAKLLAKAR